MLQPPDWTKYPLDQLIEKSLKSPEIFLLVKRADKDYLYWDTFKHLPTPKGFTAEEAWVFLKFSRLSNREATPVKTENEKVFRFTVTKGMYEKLSQIDKDTGGFLSSDFDKPGNKEKKQMIISGLTEEAIASSQIEGANTSRKAAKQMLLSERKPRNKDEQMIINNYQVMQQLLEWKDLDLSLDLLLEIQKRITQNTLDDAKDEGRLRQDDDEIAVVNQLTGEVVFQPPHAEFVKKELERLIAYANKDTDADNFVHPVITAAILHFWLAYLHPFVDGNGRASRAIFYWYLLKHDYWMFPYLSVSRIIKQSKVKYDNAFLYSEHDQEDLTYFLSYHLKAVTQAIDSLKEYYKNKLQKEKQITQVAQKFDDINPRQFALLQYFREHSNERVYIKTHQNKHRIAYETARADLMGLVKHELLSEIKIKNKYAFVPNSTAIAKLFHR